MNGPESTVIFPQPIPHTHPGLWALIPMDDGYNMDGLRLRPHFSNQLPLTNFMLTV